MMIEKNVIKNMFLELVSIDSPSGHEKKVREFIMKKMDEIGIEYLADIYGNIIARVPGVGETLLLCAHMDTVDPGRNIKAVIDGDIIKTDGETILGADDKAGITEILCAIDYLKKKQISHRPLEIVFTPEEEVGLLGAQKLDKKLLKAKDGIVVDRSGHPQSVVIASPFIMTIDIEIKGKAAHASKPLEGISAIKLACDAISNLKIGQIDEETTSNIGIIKGGEIRNGVPEKVVIAAEIRSHVKEKVQQQEVVMRKEFERVVEKQGSVNFVSKLTCDGYKHDLNVKLIKDISATWKKMGYEPFFEKTGGASDANEFARCGISVVDIGYGGFNPHTKEEFIKVSDMATIAEFIINFVKN